MAEIAGRPQNLIHKISLGSHSNSVRRLGCGGVVLVSSK